jgi:hypothetical protein
MLDYVGVVEASQNFDFPLHFIEYSLLLYFLFVKNLYRHFVVRHFVISHCKNSYTFHYLHLTFPKVPTPKFFENL